jgi:hypothetical protein
MKLSAYVVRVFIYENHQDLAVVRASMQAFFLVGQHFNSRKQQCIGKFNAAFGILSSDLCYNECDCFWCLSIEKGAKILK